MGSRKNSSAQRLERPVIDKELFQNLKLYVSELLKYIVKVKLKVDAILEEASCFWVHTTRIMCFKL